MKYYIKEMPSKEGADRMAYSKARSDANAILDSLGFSELKVKTPVLNQQINNFFYKIISHWRVYKAWCACTKFLKDKDILLIQFPCIDHSVFLFLLLRRLSKSGVTILLLIHDLELLRIAEDKNNSLTKKIRYQIEEKTIIKIANKIIVHNLRMIEYMDSIGIDKDKLVPLEVFDYLIENYDENRMRQRQISNNLPIVIAGNLSEKKAGYAYKLPKDLSFNLYGVNYSGLSSGTVSYKGSFLPDVLPYVISGSYGLIWDGNSIETCCGLYGNYLKINNPHKLSLYLVSGLPVIIWSHAASANFVQKNRVGITVESLIDLKEKLDSISDEYYVEMRKNAENVGQKLRKGFYLREAIQKCI